MSSPPGCRETYWLSLQNRATSPFNSASFILWLALLLSPGPPKACPVSRQQWFMFSEEVMTTPQPCLLPSDSAETLCHPCPLFLEDQRPRAQQLSSSLPCPPQCASESHTLDPLPWGLGQAWRKGRLQRNILVELSRCSVSEPLATQHDDQSLATQHTHGSMCL